MQHTVKIEAHPRLAEMLALADEMDAAGYPACIAGGAPRDLILGKEIKDFDFFVSVNRSPGQVERAVMTLTLILFQRYGKPELKDTSLYIGMEGSIFTLEVEGIDIVLVDMEGRTGELSIVERFDSPLCQAWIKGRKGKNKVAIETTKDFENAVKHKVLGLFRGSIHSDRITRLRVKFSDYLLLPLKRVESFMKASTKIDEWNEIKKWLKIRKEEGLKIDPDTAEMTSERTQVLDPYCVYRDLPEECQQTGRTYFARSPGSDIWVEFGDLPDETREKLWERDEEKWLISECLFD